MDAKTSDICRSMNGRVIPAEHLERQANAITAAKSMAAKKAAATWRNEPYLGRSDKMDASFGLPPYHFRCRTEVVPVWVDEYEIEGIKMKATQAPGKDEVLRHIDKTGVERVWSANNTHVQKKHPESTPQNIVKALNSIEAIAQNKDETNRLIAVSSNGMITIFSNDGIITSFDPSKNNPNDSAKKYFKRHAKNAQIIKEKWWTT